MMDNRGGQRMTGVNPQTAVVVLQTASLRLSLFLYGIRETGEIEILHLDRRNNNRSARLRPGKTNWTSNCLQIVEHEKRRIVEPEILYRLRNFSVLDEERSVSRESRIENRSRIDLSQIPETRDQHTALSGLDHVVDRISSAGHDERRRRAGWLLALLLRPPSRVVKLLQHAVIDKNLTAKRKSVAIPRLGENHRIEWISDETHA